MITLLYIMGVVTLLLGMATHLLSSWVAEGKVTFIIMVIGVVLMVADRVSNELMED